MELNFIWPQSTPITHISQDFIQGMLNRMAVSYHKYGHSRDGGQKVDLLACIQQRIDKYLETGNTEFLMDVANFAMIEYIVPKHPNAHFRATDSRESPGLTRTDGQVIHHKEEYL